VVAVGIIEKGASVCNKKSIEITKILRHLGNLKELEWNNQTSTDKGQLKPRAIQ